MWRKFLYLFLFLFVLGDLTYSFLQHYQMPLDGDMAESILPAPHYQQVFDSPLGWDAIKGEKPYANPNRFFAQWPYKEYMSQVPVWLQRFLPPIDSVYAAAAVAKTIIQLGLLLVLGLLVTGKQLKKEGLIAFAIISPLFQTNGYRSYMGIIDPSLTYTFSYAFPLLLLAVYLYPFIQLLLGKKAKQRSFMYWVFYALLAVVCSLSGPLNAGVSLVFIATVFLEQCWRNWHKNKTDITAKHLWTIVRDIPAYYWGYLLPLTVCSLYSLYVGSFNLHNGMYQASLGELYAKLPLGVYYQFTQKLGFPLLFVMILLNMILLKRKYKAQEYGALRKAIIWLCVFTLCYFMLLPLGGFRDYRPNVLRYDTVMPVTLALLFIFARSSYVLLHKHLVKKDARWYLPLFVGIMMAFIMVDKPEWGRNTCEKKQLLFVQQSTDNPVLLEDNCTLLSWKPIQDPKLSDLQAKLLKKWGIIAVEKQYYHP